MTVNNHFFKGILVYFEIFDGKVHPVSFELLGEAYRLSKLLDEPIYVITVGKDALIAKDLLKGYPVNAAYIYHVNHFFQPDIFEQAVLDCIDDLKPSIVLIGGTAEGRALAPRIAVHYKTGLTADCTELAIDKKGNLIQIRPAFGGNILAEIVTENTRPQFATVREKVMKVLNPDFDIDTKFFVKELTYNKSTMKILSVEKISDNESILNKNMIIAIGRGIKKKEDIILFQELAKLIGGGLASSRALVEKGWMSAKEQIGLSGNTVRPKCIITFGISGTVQFTAGMKTTSNIIAVNHDCHARIFEIAHYPICADLYDVAAELIDKIKK